MMWGGGLDDDYAWDDESEEYRANMRAAASRVIAAWDGNRG